MEKCHRHTFEGQSSKEGNEIQIAGKQTRFVHIAAKRMRQHIDSNCDIHFLLLARFSFAAFAANVSLKNFKPIRLF